MSVPLRGVCLLWPSSQSRGIKPSHEKIDAIANMPPPKIITELRILWGMLNYLSKFTPHLAFKSLKTSGSQCRLKQRYNLRCASSTWQLETVAPCICISHPHRPRTKVCADREGVLRAVWSYEKFVKHLVGLSKLELCTEHKPLVPLISKKPLDRAPIRCHQTFEVLPCNQPQTREASSDSRRPLAKPKGSYWLAVCGRSWTLCEQPYGSDAGHREKVVQTEAMIHDSDMGELH